MLDVILDTLLDGLKLLPFLFVAFLVIELVEHKLSKKNKSIISKAGKFSPVVAAFLGLFPQCGFSVMVTIYQQVMKCYRFFFLKRQISG